jgi:hypothetical protein
LPEERITLILSLLAENNGQLLFDALASKSNIPPLRLTGSLAVLRQLLNIEGYPVLSVDENAGDVILDIDLLRTQFDLPGV